MSSSEDPHGRKREQPPGVPHSNKTAAKLTPADARKSQEGSFISGTVSLEKTRAVQTQLNDYSGHKNSSQLDNRCPEGQREVRHASPSGLAQDKVALIDIEDFGGTQFVDNDAEYDQMEEEEDVCGNDPFANQFIHIGIPATGLKDVSRVKKDIYHDKAQAKKSIMSGLHRAVSSVKIQDNRARTTKGTISSSSASTEHTQSIRDMSGLANFRQLTRMLSLKKTKSSRTSINNEEKMEEPNSFTLGSHDPQGENSRTHTERENITHPRSEDNAGWLETTLIPEQRKQIVGRKPGSETKSGTTGEAPDQFLIQRQRESIAQKPSVKRQNLYGIGRTISVTHLEQTNRRPDVDDIFQTTSTIAAATTDRPRTSRVLAPEGLRTGGRASLSQVGRIMSLSRRKTSVHMRNDTNQHGSFALKSLPNEHVPSNRTKRSSLAKIGRAISFSRGWSASKKPDPDSNKKTQSVRTPTGGDTEVCVDIQPSNEETRNKSAVRTAALDSSRATGKYAPVCRERENVECWTETSVDNEEMSRPKLRTIGRMFSLSRHSVGTAVQSSNGDKRLGQYQTRNVASRIPKFEKGSRTQPKYDANGGKFYLVEVTSEKVKRSGLTRDLTHIRVPIVTMRDYVGPGSRSLWHTDVFTLPHNAVRRECMDLYDILVSMAQSRKDMDISADDVDDLEQWWLVAREFFKFYFEVERRILFPWVDSAGSHDLEVQLALRKMRGMKEKLQEHLAGVDRVWNEKTFKSKADMFLLVYEAVDTFVPRLFNYFEDQEVLLPAIAQSYYKAEERIRIDKEIAALLMGDEIRRNRDAPNHCLVLLIRWMNSPKLVRVWTGRYLNSWARNMYPSWYQMFETQHHRIVKTFQNRRRLLAATH